MAKRDDKTDRRNLKQRIISLGISKEDKLVIIRFLIEMSGIKWGANGGNALHTNLIRPRIPVRVDSLKTAIKISNRDSCHRIDQKFYDSFMETSDDSKRAYDLADEIITEFGSKDYLHDFWLWVNVDSRLALAERLLGLNGEYSMRCKAYNKGHYVVGHVDNKRMYIY